MLGLLLIYFIGKAFYDLAGEFQKSKWGFAILGIASYYLGTMIGGFTLGILSELDIVGSFDDTPEIVLGIIVLPIGVLTCWGTYKLLQKQWSKKSTPNNDEVLDGDLMQP